MADCKSPDMASRHAAALMGRGEKTKSPNTVFSVTLSKLADAFTERSGSFFIRLGTTEFNSFVASVSGWVAAELGFDIPLHFTAFHPDWRMRDKPNTPAMTLTRARAIAQAHGLRFVYTGNVRDRDGASTRCSGCGTLLIGRDQYALFAWALDDNGRCRNCGTLLPGIFEAQPGAWGNRRQPVAFRSPAPAGA